MPSTSRVSTAADAGQAGKPSAEDARDYARRLRSLPVGQVLGDLLFSLLNAAQVKLDRLPAPPPTGAAQ